MADNKKFCLIDKSLFSNKSKIMNTIVVYDKLKNYKNYKNESEVVYKHFTNLAT